jgi:hypothetical protein
MNEAIEAAFILGVLIVLCSIVVSWAGDIPLVQLIQLALTSVIRCRWGFVLRWSLTFSLVLVSLKILVDIPSNLHWTNEVIIGIYNLGLALPFVGVSGLLVTKMTDGIELDD